jgi:hypothetical protein
MQLTIWPLPKARSQPEFWRLPRVQPLPAAHPLSERQRAAIRQVLAVFAPAIFLVPVTGYSIPLDEKCKLPE